MNHLNRPGNVALHVAAVLFVGACTSSSGSSGMDEPAAGGAMPGAPATETNAAPVPCADDTACPPGISCVFPTSGGDMGYCDVNEMEVSGGSGTTGGEAPVSSAAPAPCTTDADCGAHVACRHLAGDSGPGFCDVNEMIAPDAGH